MKKITLIMAMVLIGTIAFGQQRGPRANRPDRPQQENMREMMATRLNLSDAQQQQMEDLRIAHLKVTADTKSQLDIKRAELEAAIKGEKSVDKLITEIGNLENKLLDARIKHRIAVRNVLDDNQKVIFDQMRQNHRGMGQGMGRPGGRGK
ncbi:Spy/CpxP family protein refolding chaperone [Marinoscillum sp.]|uniref:Spy/CpxP family protein refolding chaperone n=1 Tax=Marinoscillum sp. TaxID=2024838 RepID=UPI003BA8A54B